MRRRPRVLISLLAVKFLVIALAWYVWASMPRHIPAQRISAPRRAQAIRSSATLPISWRAGVGMPPLLPATGEIILLDGEVMVNGVAVVPGSFSAEGIGFVMEFRKVPFLKYPDLKAPLLPFWPKPEQETISAARAVDICAGITDSSKLDSQGLRLRWDDLASNGSLAVYSSDSGTPLFPGKKAGRRLESQEWHTMALEIDGKHVLAYFNDRLVLDFHMSAPLPGAVGIATHEGVVAVRKVEAYVPE